MPLELLLAIVSVLAFALLVALLRKSKRLAHVLAAHDEDLKAAPIDYVIFDGLADGHLERVVFLEVKSGASASLNANEREVWRAINEGRVELEVLSLAKAGIQPARVLAQGAPGQ